MSEITYYLWQDKNGVYYVTNYAEYSSDGLVKIDGYGFMKVKLAHSSKVKSDLWAWAQKQALE